MGKAENVNCRIIETGIPGWGERNRHATANHKRYNTFFFYHKQRVSCQPLSRSGKGGQRQEEGARRAGRSFGGDRKRELRVRVQTQGRGRRGRQEEKRNQGKAEAR